MPSSDFKVIVTRKLPDTVEARLQQLFDVELNETDVPLGRDALISAMQRADVLVPTLNDDIDAELLALAGDKLKLLANYGSGVDHIDVDAAHANGILVANSPTVSSSDTADMTIALILAVMRRFKEGSTVMESGSWQGWAPSAFLGARVSGKTLGILGMGRIGTALAERARVFGMNVHYHNRNQAHPDTETRLNATYHPKLDEMLKQADILAICCPLTEETANILNTNKTGRGWFGCFGNGDRGQPNVMRSTKRDAVAPHGVRDARGPSRNGRNCYFEYQDAPRRTSPAEYDYSKYLKLGQRCSIFDDTLFDDFTQNTAQAMLRRGPHPIQSIFAVAHFPFYAGIVPMLAHAQRRRTRL